MTDKRQRALPHAKYERFESAREYEAMLDALIPTTERAIRVFDKALDARYNAVDRCERLRRFLRADPLNRLYIVVHDVVALEAACPRLVALLQQFTHAAAVRRTPASARHVHDPFVIFDATHYLHRFHSDQMRFARGLNELDGAQQLQERFAELWEASAPVAVGRVSGL